MAEDFPVNIDIIRSNWSLASNTQAQPSPLSGAIQTLELPGAKWKATIITPELSQTDARALFAFLVSLRGQANAFNLWDHSHPTPSGSAPGSPVVDGGGQTGTQLITAGWTPNNTGILLAGDYIEVPVTTGGTELKLVTADADSDALGSSTIQIEPPLRDEPTNTSAIITSYPKAEMKLLKPESGFSASSIFSGFTIDCIENIV